MLCLGGYLDLEAKTFQRNFKGEFYPFLQALGPPKKTTLGLLRGCKRPPWPGGPKTPT